MTRAMVLSLTFALHIVGAGHSQPAPVPVPPAAPPDATDRTSPAQPQPIAPAEIAAAADPKSKDLASKNATPPTLIPNAAPDKDLASTRSNPKPTFEVRGRIEADAVWAAQSEQSKQVLGDLQNGYGFRRVRLGAQGNIGDSASWVSEVELAGGSVRLRDVFVGLDALPGVRQVRVGHVREPFNLEGMTSSNFITMMERSPANVLAPARNWGVCAYWWPDNERLLFSVGAFRDGTGSNGQSLGDGGNWACTARLTGLPVYEPDGDVFRLVHIGGGISQRVPPNGVLNVSPRSGSTLLTVDDNPGSPFLPTVNIPANSYQLFNLQAASVFGPLSLQTEWTAAMVQQTNAGVVVVNGAYILGSVFLTGEHRGYNRARGSFDQVDVLRPLIRSGTNSRGGFGAVELASRFSYLDFNSSNMPPDTNGAPAGTRLFELTVGINWYLNTQTRVMFDYTAGMPEKVGFDSTVAHLFGIRTAIYW